MTLDYNFEANNWAAAAANHPEVIDDYAATILSLVPLARARAALADWSEGGWVDVHGAEVAGMSCGPTSDWDRDYGCARGFGGFAGIEMPSAPGPFAGMALFFDDGTRFSAGLAATPLVQRFDATRDGAFLRDVLYPYLVDVADFYASYLQCDGDARRGACYLPHTCAQETCAGGEDVINAHQDLSYYQMVFSKLLEVTNGDFDGEIRANATTRAAWRDALERMPAYPTVFDPASNRTIFADSAFGNGTGRSPATSNADYGISHVSAIFPAQQVDATRGLKVDRVYFACGSGGTAAGLGSSRGRARCRDGRCSRSTRATSSTSSTTRA